MYSTCLFCNQPLGRNEVVEHFPVGRRLAYDAAKGRLWVVCRKCERWNLTPLEERWEAIEECERLYERTRVRVATDNVGLAKLDEGLELVRIGAPLRPEFAAWRYGDQFRRRYKRYLWLAGGAGAGLIGISVGGHVVGVGIGAFSWILGRAYNGIVHGSPNSTIATVRLPAGPLAQVRRAHVAESSFGVAPNGEMRLLLRHHAGRTLLAGREAAAALSLVMPAANQRGGNRRTITEAVREIENERTSEGYLARIARVAEVTTRLPAEKTNEWKWGGETPRRGLYALHDAQRLALEMALHEESERRAMEGELAELAAAWRGAEEIAAIADNLLVPTSIDERLARERAEHPERSA